MNAFRIILVVALLLIAGLVGWHLFLRRHGVVRRYPAGIVMHHTATPPTLNGKPVDVATIDAMHALRGFSVTDGDGHRYHIAYHYLVQQDGAILPGRPEHLRGAHAQGHTDMLGIALVGNFQRSSNRGRCGPLTPPPAQLHAAAALTRRLMKKYGLSVSDVYLHRDLTPTACPGDGFPRAEFYRDISRPESR